MYGAGRHGTATANIPSRLAESRVPRQAFQSPDESPVRSGQTKYRRSSVPMPVIQWHYLRQLSRRFESGTKLQRYDANPTRITSRICLKLPPAILCGRRTIDTDSTRMRGLEPSSSATRMGDPNMRLGSATRMGDPFARQLPPPVSSHGPSAEAAVGPAARPAAPVP